MFVDVAADAVRHVREIAARGAREAAHAHTPYVTLFHHLSPAGEPLSRLRYFFAPCERRRRLMIMRPPIFITPASPAAADIAAFFAAFPSPFALPPRRYAAIFAAYAIS